MASTSDQDTPPPPAADVIIAAGTFVVFATMGAMFAAAILGPNLESALGQLEGLFED
jgi:hypothetical protein